MDKINKPRVFLSHSRQDKKFIERIASDLRICDIDPWLDTYEIRDGKPWLKIIFEDGLPTCDCILVYFTRNSINSKMVKKEIDAAFIQQLEDEGIAFLPYISDDILRSELRSDIKSLHCREWNTNNYLRLLPSIVSEIWQSYLERVVKTVTIKERIERQNVEKKYIELKSKTSGTPFTKAQTQDYQFIYESLNKDLYFSVDIYKNDKADIFDLPIKTNNYKISFIQFLMIYLENNKKYYAEYEFDSFVKLKVAQNISTSIKYKNYRINNFKPIFTAELLTFGLVSTSPYPEMYFKAKMYRFKYWFEYNKLKKNISVFATKISDVNI